MSDKRKRRENFITALLIAGMCIVVAGTIIFIVKYNGDDSEALLLSAGMTEAAAVSHESAVSADFELIETTTEAPTETPAPTPEPSETPTPTPEPTDTPTPAPEKLTSLAGYDPGDVISSSKIDRDNLSQYFTSRSIEEGDSVYNRIYGQSYVDNDNIDLDELRYLKMLHINFDGDYQVGEMIVNEDVAERCAEVFGELVTGVLSAEVVVETLPRTVEPSTFALNGVHSVVVHAFTLRYLNLGTLGMVARGVAIAGVLVNTSLIFLVVCADKVMILDTCVVRFGTCHDNFDF